jgi:hypothetical protein
VPMYVRTYVCVCVYVGMYVCMYVCMYVSPGVFVESTSVFIRSAM